MTFIYTVLDTNYEELWTYLTITSDFLDLRGWLVDDLRSTVIEGSTFFLYCMRCRRPLMCISFASAFVNLQSQSLHWKWIPLPPGPSTWIKNVRYSRETWIDLRWIRKRRSSKTIENNSDGTEGGGYTWYFDVSYLFYSSKFDGTTVRVFHRTTTDFVGSKTNNHSATPNSFLSKHNFTADSVANVAFINCRNKLNEPKNECTDGEVDLFIITAIGLTNGAIPRESQN